MKSTILVLALAFGALQTVGFVDCCCGTTCDHKNECQGCEKEKERSLAGPAASGRDEVKHSCCKTGPSSGTEHHESHKRTGRCAHLEPSSDVTAQAPPVVAGLFASPVILDWDPAPLHPLERTSSPPAGFSPVGPGVPLHLFESVLQI